MFKSESLMDIGDTFTYTVLLLIDSKRLKILFEVVFTSTEVKNKIEIKK